uniref:C2H2-type domain-containing protein n=1 Tax=Leptobrachium leishanense TaxID=445787 RepID=A0A8C5PPN0_9ANUR
MNKDKARDPLTQKILDLTLEIIFLLTGEGHMVVKIHEMVTDSSHHRISEKGYCRTQSFNTEPPPHSGIHEQNNEKILELTNKIILLLTGEDHMVVKIHDIITNSSDRISEGGYRRRKSFNKDPPPHSGIHEQNNEKILELTNKIIQLLTGEVPIRCEDVTVYLSMEEWDYVERHKELYKDIMVENHQPVIELDKSVSGESHTPVSLSDTGTKNGTENITSSGENYLKKAKKERADSVTSTEEEPMEFEDQHVPWQDLYPVIEYPPANSKEEPVSCEKENLSHKIFYTSAYTKAKSNSDGDISDHDIYPLPAPTDTTCLPNGIKKEAATYFNGNLTDADVPKPPQYKQTECTPDKFRKVLKGNTNPMEINKSGSLTESKKPDQSIYYTDLIASHSVPFSEMKKEPYFESDPVIHGTYCSEFEPFFSTVWGETSTPESTLTHQHVQNEEHPFSYLEHGIQRLHTEEKPFKCAECGNGFTRHSSLARHRIIHTGEKPFMCNECGKCFTQAAYLAAHKMIHTGEKPFICHECGKCFTWASNLATHKIIHTGERPFNGSEPGKCFTSSSNLVPRKIINRREKPFKCSECGKCYTQASYLAAHIMLHTGEKPFKCPDCGKGFTRQSSLARHKIIHTGEKPFICHDCGKCFSQASYLAAHKMIHTGEKPFKCSDCGKCFTWASNFTTHKLLHKGEKTFKLF